MRAAIRANNDVESIIDEIYTDVIVWPYKHVGISPMILFCVKCCFYVEITLLNSSSKSVDNFARIVIIFDCTFVIFELASDLFPHN